MKLKEYRERKNKKIQEMADLIGVSKDVYLSWEYCKRIPRPETMAKIVAYTKGEVTANDFYGIEERDNINNE